MSRHFPPAATPPSANILQAGTSISLFSHGIGLEMVSRADSRSRHREKMQMTVAWIRLVDLSLCNGFFILRDCSGEGRGKVEARGWMIKKREPIPMSGKNDTRTSTS